jgi:hypothetical protein
LLPKNPTKNPFLAPAADERVMAHDLVFDGQISPNQSHLLLTLIGMETVANGIFPSNLSIECLLLGLCPPQKSFISPLPNKDLPHLAKVSPFCVIF